jgi:hypothetical protein
MLALAWEEVKLLLVLELDTRWGEQTASTPRPRVAPGEATQWIRGWVGPRQGG